MILMMTFLFHAPQREGKDVCVHFSKIKAHGRYFTGNYHCSEPISRVHNWKMAHNSSLTMPWALPKSTSLTNIHNWFQLLLITLKTGGIDLVITTKLQILVVFPESS